jgi:hypothetical protein
VKENWLPILVGVVVILVASAIARLAPHSALGQELRRSYGARPTGDRGNFTRRDHLRGAGFAAIAAIALTLTSIGASALYDRLAVDSRWEPIVLTYALGAFIFAAMALASLVRSLWKSARWRVELPDTPAHRRGLADAIDHLLDGNISPEERAEFLDVRYLHPQLEQIRRATMILVAQHKSDVPEGFRAQIKEWTAGIRASAGDHLSS